MADKQDLLVEIDVESSKGEANLGRLSKSANEAKASFESLAASINTLNNTQNRTATQGFSGAIQNNQLLNRQLSNSIALEQQRSAAEKQRWLVGDQGFSSAIQNHQLLNQRIQEGVAAEAARTQSLATTRYALYDVAAMYRQVGLAATAGTAAIVGTGIAFESAFTGVERTVDAPTAALQNLRNELVSLSTTMPVLFTDLSQIATIGGQMDVSASNIASFTENVAAFSATTNATIDNTAMSFGRIDQLANDSRGSFSNIASSVYEVGVKTVATETQILKMSQELAAAGHMAGFTADEVIGLSGALASLGIAPERARGSIERSFNKITAAVDNGGTALDNLASISGVSAAEFADAWNNRPTEAFMTLIQGMGRVEAAGGNFSEMLRGIGLTAVRDLDVYRRLASNVDFVGESMDIAANAWSDGSRHMEAYSLVADDVASQLKMLANTMLAVFDSMNSNKAIAALLAPVQMLANLLKEIANSPVGDIFGPIITGGMGAVAVFSLVKAGALTLQAGLLAMQLAQKNLAKSSSELNLTLRGTTKALLETSAAGRQFLATMNAAGASTSTLQKGAITAKLGVDLLKGTLMSLVRTIPWLLGISAAMKGISMVMDAFDSPAEKLEKMGMTFEGLGDAIKRDTEIYRETGEAFRVISLEAGNADEPVSALAQSLEVATDSQYSLASGADTATTAIKNQTIAVGENAMRMMVQQIASNKELQEIWRQHGPALEALGMSWETYLTKLMTGGAEEYLQGFIDKLFEAELAAERLGRVDNSGFEGTAEAAGKGIVLFETLKDVSVALSEALGGIVSEAEMSEMMLTSIGIAAEDSTGGIEDLNESASNLADTMFGNLQPIADFEAAMYNLGSSIADNGYILDAYSEGGRANLAALSQVVNAAAMAAGGDMNVLASMLAQALAALGGTGTQMGQLFAVQAQGILNQMAAATNSAVPSVLSLANGFKNQSFAAGMAARQTSNLSRANSGAGRSAKKAGRGAREAAKEIRTLSDYVKDLKSVTGDAFEFRWGLDKSTDKAADAYQDMVDQLEDAREKVDDLKQSLAELRAEQEALNADKTTLEYQLTVAQDYGDTLRENEILAEMAKNQEDINKNNRDQEKTNKDLSKAQQDLIRDLSGTTAGSREQRAAVLELLEAYQNQVIALADTGMSQAQLAVETEKLRQKFMAQMQSLGYSRAEAERYGATFKDLTKIIAAVPRNLTVDANLGPAERAIREFILAQERKSINIPVNAGGGGGGGGGGGIPSPSPSPSPSPTPTKPKLTGTVVLPILDFQPLPNSLAKTGKATADYFYNNWIPMQTGTVNPSNSNMQNTRNYTQQGINSGGPLGMGTKTDVPGTPSMLAARNQGKEGINSGGPLGMGTKTDNPSSSSAATARNQGKTGINSGGPLGMATSLNNPNNVDSMIHAARNAVSGRTVNIATNLKATTLTVGSGKTQIIGSLYSAGGYTGPGGKYDPAGVVHRGEFVFRKDQVDQSTGLPTMSALGAMMMGHPSNRGGGGSRSAAFPTTMIVELSPVDRQLLASNGNVVLTIDGKAIARTVNSNNTNSSVRGA